MDKSTSHIPAKPAATREYPKLSLGEPIKGMSSPKQFLIAPISTASPWGVPVAWHWVGVCVCGVCVQTRTYACYNLKQMKLTKQNKHPPPTHIHTLTSIYCTHFGSMANRS
jgi:hypothetical protein